MSFSNYSKKVIKISIFILVPLAFFTCVSKQESEKKPNVLFVLTDQLRSGELGVYGGRNIKTPHLDRLANQGILFHNAISMTPLCTPYRATLMSGKYPTHTGVLINQLKAYPDHQYIAKIFKDQGYTTGYIGKWHLGRHTGGDSNPLLQFIPPGKERLGFDDHWEAYNYMHTFNEGFYYKDKPERLYMDKFETDFETDRAISFIKNHKNKPEPFFLMVSIHPPHPPFSKENCPEGYWEKIQEPIIWNPNVNETDRKNRSEAMRGYLALTKNIDDNMGRLMRYLDESNLAENTIVVFTSDHGEMMGAHGYNGKGRAYAESVNVPLIIRWPGNIKAGIQTNLPQSSIDHLPTLCSMAGIDVPEPVDGIDISGIWNDKIIEPERNAVLMANYTAGSRKGLFITDYKEKTLSDPMEWRAVKTERYTYVKYIDGSEELFDNMNDKYQLNNLYKDTSLNHVKKEMTDHLEHLLTESNDKLHPGDYYSDWYDSEKVNLLKTATGVIKYKNDE